MDLNKYIATIEGFPKEGISFKDITPLLQNGDAFKYSIEKFVEFAKSVGADVIVGPESRGFIFGTPVAYAMNIGFVPIRKPGKLPRETIEYNYDLEYGSSCQICIVTPITSYPCFLRRYAATDESTPPDIPTTTLLILYPPSIKINDSDVHNNFFPTHKAVP